MSRLSAWLGAHLRKLIASAGLAVCALASVWILQAAAHPAAPSPVLPDVAVRVGTDFDRRQSH